MNRDLLLTKNVEYIDKAKAKAIWEKENESVENIEEILPESIDFYANANYINIGGNITLPMLPKTFLVFKHVNMIFLKCNANTREVP